MSGFVYTGATADEIWPLVRDFHYSARSPSPPRHAFAIRQTGGIFGDTGLPVAGLTYSQPVSRYFPTEAVELSRLVRREDFEGQLSEFISWSLRWLRANTKTPFVLSYADSTHGHHGCVYQATGFVYVGATARGKIGFTLPDGSFIHARACNRRFGTNGIGEVTRLNPDWVPTYGEPKHLYIFPLRQKWPTIARQRGWAALPYPKPKAARPLDAPGTTGREAGATPAGRSSSQVAA